MSSALSKADSPIDASDLQMFGIKLACYSGWNVKVPESTPQGLMIISLVVRHLAEPRSE